MGKYDDLFDLALKEPEKVFKNNFYYSDLLNIFTADQLSEDEKGKLFDQSSPRI